MRQQLQALREQLRERSRRGIALAFSGGVDSALLLALLREIKSEYDYPLLALYIHSPLHPSRDLEHVRRQAGDTPLFVENAQPLSIPELQRNERSRCYHCKKAIFTRLLQLARKSGCHYLIDGTNADDLHVYRPGKQALRELGIYSPLAELGITKAEIRAMAVSLGLQTASRPSAPCLATRFDYDTVLDTRELQRVEAGEQYLRERLGAEVNLRLRVHLPQLLARIEIEESHLAQLLALRKEITQRLRKLGYKQITLDLQGFRSGSMDEDITHSTASS